MKRDKGYGRRTGNNKKASNLMHGADTVLPMEADLPSAVDVDGEQDADSTDGEGQCRHRITVEPQITNVAKMKNIAEDNMLNTASMGLEHMSEGRLQSDPFVLKLLKRIADLKKQQALVHDEARSVTGQRRKDIIEDCEIREGDMPKRAHVAEVSLSSRTMSFIRPSFRGSLDCGLC